jgi:hypothetical protein
VVLDECVAEGLGDGGIVYLAVTVATVADEVDDDVGVELVAILGGEGGDAYHGSGVFRVDVEDGDGQATGEVGREARGVGLLRLRGKSDEVVDDDVNAAADRVAVDAGEVHGLGPDALASEGCVAVDDDGQDAIDSVSAVAILASAGAAHCHRVDGFEVAGVRDEMEGEARAIARGEAPGGADVVLDVASAEDAAGVDVFEFGEDVDGGLAEGVDHDAEATPMAHAHDGALRAEFGGAVEEPVEEGNECGHAFEGEALGAEIAGLDDLLEDVGAGEEVEDVILVYGRRGGFEALGEPFASISVGNMHELRADGAAIDAAGVRDVFVVEVELGDGQRAEVLCEWVELRLEVPPAAERVVRLLALVRRSVGRCEGGGGHGLPVPILRGDDDGPPQRTRRVTEGSRGCQSKGSPTVADDSSSASIPARFQSEDSFRESD